MPLTEPQRDANGFVIPHDHPEISNEDVLIRRVPPDWVVNDPKSPTGKRLSTMAFDVSSAELGGGMSIDIERLIVEAEVNIVEHVSTPPWIASLRITAGQLRAIQMQVGYSPLPENPFHGEAWGRITKGQSKTLLRGSTWLVSIPDCALFV